MSIVKWDPFKDLLSIQDRMNRLFEETILRTRTTQEGFTSGTWTPAVDVYETNTNIVLKAELPGIEQKDIMLEVKDNILVIKGERRFERDVKEENYYQVERSYGTFQRTFPLPSNVDQDNVKAKFKEGVLEVVIPKISHEDRKVIKVEIRGEN